MSNLTKILWAVCLSILISPVSADDEILDAAEAVREMIQSMDIPQAEKEQFLAQIQGVEGIQRTAIRLDIDAALRGFEQAVAEWSAIYNAQLNSLRLRRELLEEANAALDSGQRTQAMAIYEVMKKEEEKTPTEADRAPYDDRVKGWNDTCVELIEEAERDGINVSKYLLRLLDIRKEVPSHVWQ